MYHILDVIIGVAVVFVSIPDLKFISLNKQALVFIFAGHAPSHALLVDGLQLLLDFPGEAAQIPVLHVGLDLGAEASVIGSNFSGFMADVASCRRARGLSSIL